MQIHFSSLFFFHPFFLDLLVRGKYQQFLVLKKEAKHDPLHIYRRHNGRILEERSKKKKDSLLCLVIEMGENYGKI